MNHNWQAGHEHDEIEALRIQLAAAQADAKQADELTHKALDERDHYLRELQASQARFKELSALLEKAEEALKFYADDPWNNQNKGKQALAAIKQWKEQT